MILPNAVTKEMILSIIDKIENAQESNFKNLKLGPIKEYNHDLVINVVKVLREIYTDLLDKKGRGYGASWQKRGEALSIFGNLARKMDRIEINIDKRYNKDKPVDTSEDFHDTLMDCANYAVMWDAFRIIKYLEKNSKDHICGEKCECLDPITEYQTPRVDSFHPAGDIYVSEKEDNEISPCYLNDDGKHFVLSGLSVYPSSYLEIVCLGCNSKKEVKMFNKYEALFARQELGLICGILDNFIVEHTPCIRNDGSNNEDVSFSLYTKIKVEKSES